MAQNQSPAFFAVALLLFAATAPLALAQAPPALPVVGPFLPTVGSLLTRITVNGKLCCTPTVSCPGGAPLVGVLVTLVCRIYGTNINVRQRITDVNGNFSLTVANSVIQQLGPVAAIFNGPLPCSVNVQIPAGISCTLINSGNSINIGVPLITSLFLGSNGLQGIATVKNSQAGAPV